MGGSSTGMSVRTVWLSALRIVFTVWMDEQAFISKFAVRKSSEGKEIVSKAHTWSKIPKHVAYESQYITESQRCSRAGARLGSFPSGTSTHLHSASLPADTPSMQ